MNGPAKIILIHGPSSAGKTTLAQVVRTQLELPFLRFSFDLFMESGVLPMAGIRDGTFDWGAMRPAVFGGFHRCLAALAAAGNNLIVDHIIENQAWLSGSVRLLAPFDVFFVGLHCSLPELERRERLRGNRRAGEARLDFERVLNIASYDLVLNGETSPDANAARLRAAWLSRGDQRAFIKMAVALESPDKPESNV
jgi:chloramphenicol 3-O phosphotransferase